MRATVRDIPVLAQQMYNQKAVSSFALLPVEWSVELCALHLEQAMTSPTSYVSIIKRHGNLSAACGASISHLILPPSPKVVTEWMLFGKNKRDVAKVWKECKDWGKAQGALMAVHAVHQPSCNPIKYTEVLHWRKL